MEVTIIIVSSKELLLGRAVRTQGWPASRLRDRQPSLPFCGSQPKRKLPAVRLTACLPLWAGKSSKDGQAQRGWGPANPGGGSESSCQCLSCCARVATSPGVFLFSAPLKRNSPIGNDFKSFFSRVRFSKFFNTFSLVASVFRHLRSSTSTSGHGPSRFCINFEKIYLQNRGSSIFINENRDNLKKSLF